MKLDKTERDYDLYTTASKIDKQTDDISLCVIECGGCGKQTKVPKIWLPRNNVRCLYCYRFLFVDRKAPSIYVWSDFAI